MPQLVSSKYLTAFSDHRLPRDAPDYVPPSLYVQYLNEYCDRYQLRQHIECSSPVTRVRRTGDGGHIVTVTRQDGTTFDYDCDAVAVCSGLNVEPRIPPIKGIERIPKVLHSSEFKTRDQLRDIKSEKPTVVIVGTGETAQDLGHLAATTETVQHVVMCHRDGFIVAPKVRHRGPSLRLTSMTSSTDRRRLCRLLPCSAFGEGGQTSKRSL